MGSTGSPSESRTDRLAQNRTISAPRENEQQGARRKRNFGVLVSERRGLMDSKWLQVKGCNLRFWSHRDWQYLKTQTYWLLKTQSCAAENSSLSMKGFDVHELKKYLSFLGFFSLLQSIVINVFKANECVRQRQRLLSYFLRFIKVGTLYQNPQGLGRSVFSCGWRPAVPCQRRASTPSQLYQDPWPVSHVPWLSWRGGPFVCTGDVEEASAGNGRAQSREVFLILWNGVGIKEAKRRSDVFSSEEKNQLFRFFQQHNSLSSLSQRHTTLWQLIQQPCGLESILFWVLPSWRSIASQGPWRSLDVWQTKAVQLPQGPSHFSRQPKWLSQCCFLVIFKTQGVRSQSSILCRGRLKMRGRMSIIRTLQKEFVSSRNWVHSLKFLKGISDLISEAN